MAARAEKLVSIDLGEYAEAAKARVRAGQFASLSEVVREGLRVLDREDAKIDALFEGEEHDWDDPEVIALVKPYIDKALNDPRPAIPAAEVFARLRQRHAELVARDV